MSRGIEIQVSRGDEILRMEQIELGFGKELHLLLPTDASLEKGEMVALIGRNGSGKSTLLKTISGILSPRKGKITIHGEPLYSIDKKILSKKLAFVGTNLQLNENMTVYELVALGRHPYTNWWGKLDEIDEIRIEEALRFVDMLHFSKTFVNTLSDGERQRVLIASALAQDTDLIVLDEPTAFLDIPNKLSVAEVLYQLKLSGKTVLYSTHDFEAAMNYSDRLWILHQKELLIGSPEDLGLAGAFSKLYQQSDILFDEVDLRFRRKNTGWTEIHLSGKHDMVYNWTKRALERISYKCVDNKMLSLQIKIENKGDSVQWHVTKEGVVSSYTKLYDLAAYLTSFQE